MRHKAWSVFRRSLRNLWGAIRARPKVFVGVAAAVFLLNLFLPVLVLSVARKPWDHFSFNPWLSQLPKWLVSPEATIGRKLEFLSKVTLFWFVASSSYYGTEWGFSAGVNDVIRWVFVSCVFGAYFALWLYARSQLSPHGRRWSGHSGVAGGLISTLGLTTAPCSVVGCGYPLLPVFGLALQGLTSGVLAGLATLSRIASVGVQAGMIVVVLVLGARVNFDSVARREDAVLPREGSPTQALPTSGKYGS